MITNHPKAVIYDPNIFKHGADPPPNIKQVSGSSHWAVNSQNDKIKVILGQHRFTLRNVGSRLEMSVHAIFTVISRWFHGVHVIQKVSPCAVIPTLLTLILYYSLSSYRWFEQTCKWISIVPIDAYMGCPNTWRWLFALKSQIFIIQVNYHIYRRSFDTLFYHPVMGIHYMNCQTEISSLDANPAVNSGRNRPALASLSKKVLRSSRLACLQPYGACIKTVVHDATFTTADSQTFDSCDHRYCPIVLTNKLYTLYIHTLPVPSSISYQLLLPWGHDHREHREVDLVQHRCPSPNCRPVFGDMYAPYCGNNSGFFPSTVGLTWPNSFCCKDSTRNCMCNFTNRSP